jgi:hypothetical protein
MDFPITKQRLQNFHQEWLVLERTNYINKVVEEITKQVLAKAKNYSMSSPMLQPGGGVETYRRLVYQPIPAMQNLHEHPANTHSLLCIPGILEKLKERFPDCRIDIDPLRTYIIVDWS